MSENLLESVVRALNRADLEPLHNALSDQIVWKSAATMKGMFRFGGQYEGPAGVEELIREFEKDYMIRSVRPKEIISHRDVTWGLFWAEFIYKPTFAQLSFDWVIRWRLKDGKVIEHQAFMDTAAALVRQHDGPLVGH